MNVTPEDKKLGFKEIQVAMLDGKLEIVRVTAPKPDKLMALMVEKLSAKTVYDFVGAVTGKHLRFVLEINPESYTDIFITASGLLGLEESARQAAMQAGLRMIRKASQHGS
jgi:hypothetical protein